MFYRPLTTGGSQMSRIGELLLREKRITKEQLDKAIKEQKESGDPNLFSTLIRLDYFKEAEITSFLSKQYHVPHINLSEFEIDADCIDLIPKETARKYRAIPVNQHDSSLIVALDDPTNNFAIDDLKFLTGYNIEVVIASPTEIDKALAKYYGDTDGGELELGIDETVPLPASPSPDCMDPQGLPPRILPPASGPLGSSLDDGRPSLRGEPAFKPRLAPKTPFTDTERQKLIEKIRDAIRRVESFNICILGFFPDIPTLFPIGTFAKNEINAMAQAIEDQTKKFNTLKILFVVGSELKDE